jgi:hypothetical protein
MTAQIDVMNTLACIEWTTSHLRGDLNMLSDVTAVTAIWM